MPYAFPDRGLQRGVEGGRRGLCLPQCRIDPPGPGGLPADAVVLVSHDTFGMDLAPGLSIKLDSAFVSDVVGIEGVEGSVIKLVRQEYGGAVSTHVNCDISGGVVLNIRPGAFQADENPAAGGSVVDKSGEVGGIGQAALSGNRGRRDGGCGHHQGGRAGVRMAGH